MGASSNIKKNKEENSYIPALLISFSKINEFNKYLEYTKDKEGLTKIFYALIHSFSLLDGYVLEFNKILDEHFKEKSNRNIKILLDFILEKLHEELNQNQNEEGQIIIDEIKDNDELQAYKEFLNYYKTNKSPIQDLFFGEKENITRCSLCKKTKYLFDINKFLYFDIKQSINSIDMKDLITDSEKQKECKSICKICNQNGKLLSRTFLKKLPEILILCFDNVSSLTYFQYYINLTIQDEPYQLICFIIISDEDNKKDEKYNVFYLENEKWLIYNVTQKEVKKVEKITSITKNPLVTFYQKRITHDRIFLNKCYINLCTLFNSLQEFPKKVHEHIKDEKNFEKYYIINKKIFNKLTKIFESEEKYQNDNLIFDTFNQVTNIPNLTINELKETIKLVKTRLKEFKNEKIFELEFEKNEDIIDISYPKDFVLIKEKELNEFLINYKININYVRNNLCDVLLGENYLFIKSNIYEDKNIYYICNSFLFLVNVEKILRFKDKKFFIREMGYIKNKGGIDSYLELRHLNIAQIGIQKIIDRENENIGDFINIICNKTLADINKYFFNKSINQNINSMVYTSNSGNNTNFNDMSKYNCVNKNNNNKNNNK